MVWIQLGTYAATLEEDPALYDVDGRWVELLRDPPNPKPYTHVRVTAEVTVGASYWYVCEDPVDIAVSRVQVTRGGCRHEPWLTVTKGTLRSRRQRERVRLAFASAGSSPESVPRFLGRRLLRASTV